MKLLLVSNPSNPHTIKWANSLAEKGIDIFLFGLTSYDKNQFNSNIKIKTIHTPDNIKDRLRGSIYKSYYLKALPLLNKIIREFKPDILHSHYASSYGILGALTNFHPFIISVWGYDIMTFPAVSFLHKKIIEFTLGRADCICATSKYLASLTKNYTKKNIDVIPFGIDTNKFMPKKVESLFSKNDIVIGTIKSLEAKYGYEILIEAFSIIKKRLNDNKIKLLIVGSGTLIKKYKDLVKSFNIEDSTIFTGEIPYSEISRYHNMIDIHVYVSYVESFGVSVLEAGAVEKPVIVSNVGGLPEVVEDEKSGIIVPADNLAKTADAIEKLIKEKEFRTKLGKSGRRKVMREYEWDKNLEQMIELYRKLGE